MLKYAKVVTYSKEPALWKSLGHLLAPGGGWEVTDGASIAANVRKGCTPKVARKTTIRDEGLVCLLVRPDRGQECREITR